MDSPKPGFTTFWRLVLTTQMIFFIPSACHELLSNTFNFETNIAISNLDHLEVYESLDVRSIVECSQMCSGDSTCKSFYFHGQIAEEDPWQCWLMSGFLHPDSKTHGHGIYGHVKDVSAQEIPPPPAIINGIYLEMKNTTHGLIAVYDCSGVHPKATTVSLLYNENLNNWPISESCLESMCAQTGLSSTIISFTKFDNENDNSSGHPICAEGEEVINDFIYCESGMWQMDGPGTQNNLGVGCLSQTCARYNGDKMMYSGNVSVTENGMTCQRWDSQSPWSHNYPASSFETDMYSLENAANYCRDPGLSGFLWCYQMSGDRWAKCDVPLC